MLEFQVINLLLTNKKIDSKLYNWYIEKSQYTSAHVAQSAERRLGKAEVVGSIPIMSSMKDIN